MTGRHRFRHLASLAVVGLLICSMAFLGVRMLQQGGAISGDRPDSTGLTTVKLAPPVTPHAPANTTSTAVKPTFYLTPPNGSFVAGSTVSIGVRAASPETALTAVQPILNYPADKLQYLNVTEGGVFKTVQRTRTMNGAVDIIRGISGGSSALKGDNLIVTVHFKVLTNSGAAVTLGKASAAFDNSGSGTNILDAAGSRGATYTPPGAAPGPGQPQAATTVR